MNALSLIFDQYAALNPESGYWLDFEDSGDGTTHCLKCIKKLDAGRDKYTGYGGASEEDGCLHCGTCGKLLDYTLTDYGASSELDRFKTIKFRRDKPLDRITAYEIARMLAAKGDDLDAVLVAARAIRCMRRIPSLSQSE